MVLVFNSIDNGVRSLKTTIILEGIKSRRKNTNKARMIKEQTIQKKGKRHLCLNCGSQDVVPMVHGLIGPEAGWCRIELVSLRSYSDELNE